MDALELVRAFNSRPVHFIPQPGRTLSLGESTPEYTDKHSGVALVVGTHPCWHDDLEAALAAYPDADLIAVNDATQLIRAKHLVTAHDENLHRFIAGHLNKWGNDLPIIHVREQGVKDDGVMKYVWPAMVGGGSAPFAAAIALHIGYSLAVLCGCPMDGGGGYAAGGDDEGDRFNPRLGYIDSKHSMVGCWRHNLREMKAKNPELAERIRSVSGYSKEFFGGIDGN